MAEATLRAVATEVGSAGLSVRSPWSIASGGAHR